MNSIIEIIEIGERPPTGVSSNPFRCLGEDGKAYYVKLGNASPAEKICEWICGFLAAQMGLHTPIGRVVSVDEKLSKSSAWDTTEFGFGIGYGSEEFNDGEELIYSDLERIALSVQSDVLLFDWWILNEDRKLGKLGGNPNILKSQDTSYCLIDHGSAFDPHFNETAFFRDHAFEGTRSQWRDETSQAKWLQLAEKTLISMAERWDTIPEEWQSPELGFEEMMDILKRPWESPQSFWAPFR